MATDSPNDVSEQQSTVSTMRADISPSLSFLGSPQPTEEDPILAQPVLSSTGKE
jgi:hypothetical protein